MGEQEATYIHQRGSIAVSASTSPTTKIEPSRIS